MKRQREVYEKMQSGLYFVKIFKTYIRENYSKKERKKIIQRFIEDEKYQDDIIEYFTQRYEVLLKGLTDLKKVREVKYNAPPTVK
jgi:hypothetical protein